MEDKPNVGKSMAKAIEDGDLVRFKQLLGENPNLVRFRDGRSQWLFHATACNQLQIVQHLIAEGEDINQPQSIGTFSPPEGVVFTAASEGFLELTRWLLDNGAKLNHVVNGQLRCFALSSTAGSGHLECVKLLIERGAAVNSAWAKMTPLDHALTYRQDAVVDYLRSVGAKTAEELG